MVLQGRGIKLVQSSEGLKQALKELEGVEIIASEYLMKMGVCNLEKCRVRVF